MKNYQSPEIELLTAGDDIITTSSLGTETTPMPDGGGIWDLDIG